MMRDRVLKAYDLLSDDGSLWVHLDDTELYHFKLVLDEIFGKENFVANIVWQKGYSPHSNVKLFSTDQNYILIFAKNIEQFKINRLPRTEKQNKLYKNLDNDPRGLWRTDNFSVKAINPKN